MYTTSLPTEVTVERGLQCGHGQPRLPVSNPQRYYQTFEQGPADAKAVQEPPLFNYFKHRRPFVVWAIVLTIMVFVGYIAWTMNGFSIFNGSDPVFLNPTDNTITRSCTFAECQRTMCDPDLSPFVCTAGAAHDGCAATAAVWAHTTVCTDYCDVSQCTAAPPSKEDPTRKCDLCTPQQCMFYGAKCTAPAVFVCVQGSARYGCSADPYAWPYSLNGICTECCNNSACRV